MKKFLFFLSTLFVASSVWADDFEVDGLYFNFTIYDEEVEVAPSIPYHSSYSGSVAIPSAVKYNGTTYSVTSIARSAFQHCTGLTSITIPNSVTSIGNSAFYGCTGLTSVTIPESITSIGEDVFRYCTGLTSVTIPESVTSIGNSAFTDCAGLTSVTIPESVTSIGNWAFFGCTGVTSVTINGDVDVSKAYLYFIKDGLQYRVLNKNSVEVIADGYYDEDEYYHKTSSGDIIIPKSVTAGNTYAVVAIGNSAFSGCTGLTSITIPNSVTSIGNYAFDGCTGLTSVTIPESITSIGGYVFYDCTGLTSVTIPESVTSIVEYAFKGCAGLTSITIPNSVTSIGNYAFSGCTKLKDVTCLATTPPEAYANTFENYNGYLHVPCESKDDYEFASCWGSFKHVECIGAETVELTKDEVTVEPEKTEALFSVPVNGSANSYTLTIQNNGVTFCTLTFNAQGQLSNIDFSTTKSYELKASVSAYQFTVTGLSEATNYGYSFKALASNKSVLKEYTGSFTTKNGDGTGGSSQGGTSTDEGGQGSQGGEGGEQGGEGGNQTAINGVSNAIAITIANNQILVNGDAPAFVVTTSGKKIANQNLKSGVYFVVVDGETVKVVLN